MLTTTTDGGLLLRAILAEPDEDTPRLMYADWLNEHGEPDRAEFVRVQCELERLEGEIGRLVRAYRSCFAFDQTDEWRHSFSAGCGCEYCSTRSAADAIRRREGELLDAHLAAWFADPCWNGFVFLTITPASSGEDDAPFAVVRRGFVESVALPAADFVRHATTLLSSHPIREVTLTTRMRWLVTREGASLHSEDSPFYRCRCKPPPGGLSMPSDEYAKTLLEAEWPTITFHLPARLPG